MNELFSNINGFFEKILFFDIFFGQIEGVSFPFVVAWLIAGGVFLTFKMGFVNLKMLPHSLAIVRGKYHTKDDKGIITPFESLTTALSATVGIGNIAAVAIAISIGWGWFCTSWMAYWPAFSWNDSKALTEVHPLNSDIRKFLPDGSILGRGYWQSSKSMAFSLHNKLWHTSWARSS